MRPGEIVQGLLPNSQYAIGPLLGEGGQGQVFLAQSGGQKFAIKWYLEHAATELQRSLLQRLIDAGAPSASFLWPIDLVKGATSNGFGYVMAVRPGTFRDMNQLMNRRAEPSFAVLSVIGMRLAHNFLLLHSRGLCYRDINLGNVFFDPRNGDVLICDNDNVAPDGELSGVGGTIGFMAPEVLRGEVNPNIHSDQFSLAVLLFHLFLIHHPFHGKVEADIHCLDFAAKMRLYGDDAVFVFHPEDHSNAPVPGYHDNALVFWPLYPAFLRELFVKSFTIGVNKPDRRVVETEWRQALARLRDAIFYCGTCGSENFYARGQASLTTGKTPACWQCKREVLLPPRIRVGRHIVMLNHDSHLFPHHVDDGRMYDFSQPVASVIKHPTDSNAWGLANVGSSNWVATFPSGSQVEVPPGKSATIKNGVRLHFGKSEGEVRAEANG